MLVGNLPHQHLILKSHPPILGSLQLFPMLNHGLLPHNALPLKNSELQQNKTWSRVTNEPVTFQDTNRP